MTTSSTFDFHRSALKAPSTPYKLSARAKARSAAKEKIERRLWSIETILRVLKRTRLPFVLEWTLAWSVVLAFGALYMLQYAWLVIRTKASNMILCQNKKVERSRWLSTRLSITTMPRTKNIFQARLDPWKQLNYRLNRLSLVLNQALAEQGFAEEFRIKHMRSGSPTSVRDRIVQHSLRRRMHRQQRRRFESHDSDGESSSCSTMTIPMATDFNSFSDAQIVQVMQSSGVARYLASLVMNMSNLQRNNLVRFSNDNHRQLLRVLGRVWMDVVSFPPLQMIGGGEEEYDEEKSQDSSVLTASSTCPQSFEKEYLYTISLIVPIYRESLATVRKTLDHALKQCCDPEHVQVVLVNVADECPGLEEWCERANHTSSKARAEARTCVVSPRSVTKSRSNFSSVSSFSSSDSTSSTPVLVPLKIESQKVVSNGNGYAYQQDDQESTHAEFILPLNSSPRRLSTPRKINYQEFEENEEQRPLMEPVVISRTTKRRIKSWNRIKHVVFHNTTGGRGASLNYGAMHARGRILTFLHSDTLLPADWDVHVESALLPVVAEPAENYAEMVTPPRRWRDYLNLTLWWKRYRRKRRERSQSDRVPTFCAFSFGIDTSRQGLDGQPYRPGLRGALWLGILRCNICNMPYGDSAPSMPAAYFHHIGGFPDQPLMEDYELVTLIRRRTQLMPNECMVILPVVAKCSPRRWQKYGIAYTTLVNALCIWRYNHGWTADDLFHFYYGD